MTKQLERNNKKIWLAAILNSFIKLKPSEEMRNPVMFVTFVCSIITTAYFFRHLFGGTFSLFELLISIWLWFTVLFANFAEALAEGRGKAQAESLKRSRKEVMARLLAGGQESVVLASALKKNDIVVCEANDLIPADGEVIEGIASVDESAITGESAPVIVRLYPWATR